MIVVLDTSCISTFIRINQVDLLLSILHKHEVVITEQVSRELRVSKLELLKNFQHPRITVKNTSSKIADKYQIHIGEASVITFAKENNALAIIDDKKAREAAEKEGVSFVGTVTLIRLGVEKGTIKRSEISSLIEQITTIGRLYVSEDLRKWIMR